MKYRKPASKKLMLLPLILGISYFSRLRFIITAQTMHPMHTPTL